MSNEWRYGISSSDNIQYMRAILSDWLVIVGCLYIICISTNFLVIILCLPLIAGRQHALLVLMHDFSHRKIFFKNRKHSDLFANLFLGWPHIISVESYRRIHILHHTKVNSQEDPDLLRKQDKFWIFPMSKMTLAKAMLSDLFFIGGFKLLKFIFNAKKDNKSYNTKPSSLYQVLYLSFMVTTLSYFGLYKVLITWVVCSLLILPIFLRLRSIAEHFGIDYSNDQGLGMRTTLYNRFESLFIGPHNIGHHAVHHVNPMVPFYELPKLTQEYYKDTNNDENHCINTGFFFGKDPILKNITKGITVTH